MNEDSENMLCNISWFGRCCFLVDLNHKKILFDPYDQFCNVDMGMVDADILISSSTWHDHGHIGASPGAWVFTYAGGYENSGFVITGIEAKEARGSPTVVFNLNYQNISITNFADLGEDQDEDFRKNMTSDQENIIDTSNIIFMRPNNKNILKYCNPKLIFLEHYFPRNFVDKHIPEEKKQDFINQSLEIDKFLQSTDFPVKIIDSYKMDITQDDFIDPIFVKLLQIHPQVKYADNSNIIRHW